jgi:hypothetical protein
VPAFFYLCYFVELSMVSHIYWSIHMWMGAIVLAGLVGLLLSYLLLPPQGEMVE